MAKYSAMENLLRHLLFAIACNHEWLVYEREMDGTAEAWTKSGEMQTDIKDDHE